MNRIILRQAARLVGIILLTVSVLHSELRAVRAQTAEGAALVDAVNAYRESIGLPRLSTSNALMIAAQRHVDWMAANYTYSHTGEGGTRPEDRAAAAGYNGTVRENVGGSTTATPGEMVYFWDQSHVHQVTMRAAQATHIGAGFAANDDQRLFVLLIGTAPGQAPPPGSPPLAGGTPAIAYTPPPNLGWSTDGEYRQGSDYVPAAVGPSEPAASVPGVQAPPTEAPYVMPFDMIRLAEPGADGSIVHVVEAGQTAWAIATRYGVDLQELIALNRLGSRPVLHQGDTLIIRLGEGGAPPPAPTVPSDYTVQAGDSLWTIAARHHQSVSDLRAWNNLTVEDVIQPGDVLLIAPPAPTLTPTVLSSSTPTGRPAIDPLPASAALPTASQSPTSTAPATAMPATSPSPETPTLLPPVTEIAQIVTAAPIEVKEAAASPQRGIEFLLLLLVGGLGAAAITVIGSVVTWLAQKGRRKSIESRQ